MMIFRAFGAIVERLAERVFFLIFLIFGGKAAKKLKKHALCRVSSGAGEAGKISKNLNTGVLTLFMVNKPDKIIKIVSLCFLHFTKLKRFSVPQLFLSKNFMQLFLSLFPIYFYKIF